MDREQLLAFRFARSGLTDRDGVSLAQAAACPASDFARDAALLALGARSDDVTPDAYAAAVDAGDIVVAHVPRGAIHAVAPDDVALYGRNLIARDDKELGQQLGRQVQRLAAEHGFAPGTALDEVGAATSDALGAEPLDKTGLHEALRQRVRPELMPFCRGCQSHHVAPMLWRFATVQAGARLDAQRRYRLGDQHTPDTPAAEVVRRFLRFYGPATLATFVTWAGLARTHAQRLWDEVADDLVAVGTGRSTTWLLDADQAALASPPPARGVRLLPPGDPYLQPPNRPLLAPDDALRKRLFRPVASPGAVTQDGRLVGLWRAKVQRGRLTLAVEPLGQLDEDGVAQEARRMAALRGAQLAAVTVG